MPSVPNEKWHQITRMLQMSCCFVCIDNTSLGWQKNYDKQITLAPSTLHRLACSPRVNLFTICLLSSVKFIAFTNAFTLPAGLAVATRYKHTHTPRKSEREKLQLQLRQSLLQLNHICNNSQTAPEIYLVCILCATQLNLSSFSFRLSRSLSR